MELEILRYIQSFANPFWDSFFKIVTMLAEQNVIVLVLGWIYWNDDKEAGQYLGYAMLTSMVLNNGIKDIFRFPRPIGQPGIRTVYADTATGYSFPSGHTQLVSSFGTSAALWYKKNRLWVAAIITMLLVGFSRMYLGVHYPKDVAVALVLGVTTAGICSFLYYFMYNRMILYIATFVAMLPFLFFAQSPDYFKSIGMFAGFLCGIAIEKKYVRFSVPRSFLRKLVRLLLGLLLLGGLMAVMKVLFPATSFFYFARYGIISVFGYGLYPMLFKKLKL